MFSMGTLVNVPHFRGKALLVVDTEGPHTICLWSSDDGAWGEVLVPTSLLQEIQPAPTTVPATSPPASQPDPGDTLPADWFRKQAPGKASDNF